MDLSLSSSMEDEQRLARREPFSQAPAARDLEDGYLDKTQQDYAQKLNHSSFAEALLFAQSRAREAEEVLYSYDVRVEEAVLRALTFIDSSRHKEMLCQQRLEQLKRAVLEEEESELQRQQEQNDEAMSPHLDSALERTVLRGISLMSESDFAVDMGGLEDDACVANGGSGAEHAQAQQSCGLLLGAYEKLMSVAMHGTSSSSAAPSQPIMPSSILHVSPPEHSLSIQLAQAYADVREAQESTERHEMLLQELEMLVEPVLQYRHSGVYDSHRYDSFHGVPRGGGRGSTIESGADSDGMEVACQTPEGSSVVWVQHADALGEEDARDAAGCFALLTAKVKSQEESRRLRNVLSRVQTALDSFECLHHQDAGHRGRVQSTAASASLSLPVPGGNRVEDKVASLVTLLQSQQDEINSLRKQLESSKGALPSTRPKRELDACAHSAGGVFLDHGRGATLFLQKKRLHVDGVTDDQSEESTPRHDSGTLDLEAAQHKEPEESGLHGVYRSGVYARALIQYSAAQAHMLIDACEEMLLQSMAVALEMLDQALCFLIVPVVYEDAGHKLQTCADAHRRPRLASYEVSWCSCPSSIPDCNWKGKSDTDVEWWWGGSDTLYQVYC